MNRLRVIAASSLLAIAAGLSVNAWAASELNVNQTSAKALQALKGIGPKTAAAIVNYRQQHGHYKSAAGLSAVKGLSMKRISRIEKRNDVKLVTN